MIGDRVQITEGPVAPVSGCHRLRLAVLVTVLIVVAGISTSAQARTPPDPSPLLAASDPGPKFTAVADRFRLRGQITEGGIADDNIGLRPNGKLPFARAHRPNPRRRQMPLDLNVVRFPGAKSSVGR